jgi:hypothetical protein
VHGVRSADSYLGTVVAVAPIGRSQICAWYSTKYCVIHVVQGFVRGDEEASAKKAWFLQYEYHISSFAIILSGQGKTCHRLLKFISIKQTSLISWVNTSIRLE